MRSRAPTSFWRCRTGTRYRVFWRQARGDGLGAFEPCAGIEMRTLRARPRSCWHFAHLLRDRIGESTKAAAARATRDGMKPRHVGVPRALGGDAPRPRWRPGFALGTPRLPPATVTAAAAAARVRRPDIRAACIYDRSCVAGADPRSRVPLVHGWERTQPTGCAQRLQPKRMPKRR